MRVPVILRVNEVWDNIKAIFIAGKINVFLVEVNYTVRGIVHH